MKQALDSLLAFNQISFNAILDASALSRKKAGAIRPILTRFNPHRERLQQISFNLPGKSYPPQCIVRSRLGEGRILGLFHQSTLSSGCHIEPEVSPWG